jgi:Ran GTPase-activating protein (RanGAP) involved in mRNA processing and transport
VYNWHANGQLITTENLVGFLSGFASNRSIRKLSIANWDFSDVGIQDNLIRFFTDNQTIESLIVREKRKRGDGWKVRISALGIILKSFNSLKEISLSSDDEDRGLICVDDVLEGLVGHAGLSKIYLPRVRIERRGCTALATLLENLNSNHTSLTLSHSEFNAEGARILANGIISNTSLSELNLDQLLYITKHGWMAIFDALQRSTCRLDMLSVESNYFFDDDNVARSMSLAILHHNSTLKTLRIGNNRNITVAGWATIFRHLREPDCMLETLSLTNSDNACSITDDVLAALTNVLQNNRKLTKLDLSHNTAVTIGGLISFSTILSNPNSALVEVSLTDCRINNYVMTSFAEALVNNKTLRVLELNWLFNTNISFTGTLTNGCAAFTRLLCNKSSIMSTYNSNHTLERINRGVLTSDRLPDDLASLLRLNGKNTVSQAARLKIIKSHFSGREINMQPFIDMGNCVRPHAIAWMVRDENAFQLLRAVPILLKRC